MSKDCSIPEPTKSPSNSLNQFLVFKNIVQLLLKAAFAGMGKTSQPVNKNANRPVYLGLRAAQGSYSIL